VSAISTGPPPWPIPPSWAPPPASPAEPPVEQPPAPSEPPEHGTPEGAVVVFGADVEGAETRPLPGPADGFELAHELARAVAQAANEGARGVVVAPGVATPEEAAWALELLYAGDAPLVLAPDTQDLADALAVAASGVHGLGCVLVSRGEIHAARYVVRAGAAAFGSPAAGPLGRVVAGSVRLLWRPPARVTVSASPGERSPLVGLYTIGFGDDGRALRALAGQCDGLVVAGGVPDRLASALAERAARIPVVLSGTHAGPLAATMLDPAKARILMRLLLEAGRDREAILAAFAEAENPEGARL
jgi:L-asparaginase